MPNSHNEIAVRDLEPITVLASATGLTQIIPLREIKPNGDFSIIATVTGDGTASIDYLIGYLDSNMVQPVTDSLVISGLTKTSGTASDGIISEPLTPNVGKFLQFKVTETGTSNSVIVQISVAIT